jgi:hypothetical protein
MPQTPVTVPEFPNVPIAAGVPALLRPAGGVANALSGSLVGVLDAATGEFTGAFDGLLSLAGGAAGPVLGTLRGVLDGSFNFTAALSGDISGRAIGTLAGAIGGGGPLTGVVSGILTQVAGQLGSLGADAASVEAQAEPFEWGIFKDGAAAVVGDNVTALDFRREYKIATYPLEQGAFESYNKVEIPYDLELTFTKGGTDADRIAFITSLEAAVKSLELYEVLTPEVTYSSVNVVGYQTRRTADKGATLMHFDVALQKVRTTAVTTFTNTKDPAAAGTVNDGPVQPVNPAVYVPPPSKADVAGGFGYAYAYTAALRVVDPKAYFIAYPERAP